MIATAPTTFTPRSDFLHVRLLTPADRTAGGVILPETARVNQQEAVVIAAGPGWLHPGRNDRATVWTDPGDQILFRKHDFHPLTPDSREGTVRDRDVIAILSAETGQIAVLLGEWLLIEPDEFQAQKGSILVPEIDQRKPPSGRILKCGPGRLVEDRPWKRHSMGALLDVPEKQVLGLRVWWRRTENVMDVGREVTTGTLVQARDVLGWEE